MLLNVENFESRSFQHWAKDFRVRLSVWHKFLELKILKVFLAIYFFFKMQGQPSPDCFEKQSFRLFR